ncbi:putative selenate reductase subunit YgfK [Christensenellaceae bacterium OttesenSCG-928-L17]|nr:putative selenate reductase subunit YgfK [Christensenellaceae bacterium OttesenSCG-928-L17]
MSDKMTPIPFGDLMQWVLTERQESGSVFGVERPYIAQPEKSLPIFEEKIETPFGPAAGPHTQLAQNIIAAYYAGARFFELKTVQIMDGEELSKCVPKPCILADDEGYNCEWSTELTVQDAMNEYIKAWFACKLMAKEFALGAEDGFVFNLSVGYDFAGITSKKIDDYLCGMMDAGETEIFAACKAWALENLRLFENVNARYIEHISPKVCTSATLSTLHGCPPEEIEKIASYLIQEKGLHTYVKCNPTILGYESARKILDQMGYDYIAFDDHHFREDLQFKDAIPMFLRLKTLAAERGVEFGLKLSNTFPVDVKNSELPSEEMYMSGRSLFPLTIEMANRITEVFDGKLRISFSGGADAFNCCNLFGANIWPITVATTALKPGGYSRFTQLAKKVEGYEFEAFDGVRVSRVKNMAKAALSDPHHKKPIKPLPNRKLSEPLPLMSCFTAPCKSGCPIGQDIPEYVELVGKGKYVRALKVITEKNPLPFITGRICPHHCADKCMRAHYDESVRIRNAKLEAARNGVEGVLGDMETPVMTSTKRAAVIGSGPAGLAAAFFLGRAGMPVTLYEQKESLGGIVRHVIPRFRISDYAIDRDIKFVEKMGVRFKLGKEAPSVSELKAKGYDYVLLAVGAWKPGSLALEAGEAQNVLEFLEAYKSETLGDIGRHVCVVGGGNTAMDAARAARRVPGVESVSVVYRRTKRYMPADEEELELALEDGVAFRDLLSPVSLQNGQLLCRKMTLGAPDASGRRAPVETEETVLLPCDTLIAAVGERVDTELMQQNGVESDARGRVQVNAKTLETNIPGVYVLGDARRGPATVVEAIADAQMVADAIVGAREDMEMPKGAYIPAADCRKTAGSLCDYESAAKEANRCLKCNTSCEVCAQVCPNRANIAVEVAGMEMRQIVHIDRMCNECGNCAVFCPYDGAPYLQKPTLFHTTEEFAASNNAGFVRLAPRRFRVRLEDVVRDINLDDIEIGLPRDMESLMFALEENYAYLF